MLEIANNLSRAITLLVASAGAIVIVARLFIHFTCFRSAQWRKDTRKIIVLAAGVPTVMLIADYLTQ